MINDIHISEHFKLSEFQSGDTQEVKIDPGLVEKLEKLRKRIGQPLVINSGYRTKEHHVNIYKDLYGDKWKEKIAWGSLHLKGIAGDIAKVKGLSIDEMAVLAQKAGFDGIGKYDWGIHVDVRGNGPARWDNR